ncbi:hypothetical protein EPUL_006497, partial [Erysiphe pulchra]
ERINALHLQNTHFVEHTITLCVKQKHILKLLRIFQQIPPQEIIAYTDASRIDSPTDACVEGGVVIYQAGQVILRKDISLSPTLSTFDAEVIIATKAIEEALLLPTIRFSNVIWLLIDNQEVARKLLRTPLCSFQKLLKKIRVLNINLDNSPQNTTYMSG